jgi:hypothetical protein
MTTTNIFQKNYPFITCINSNGVEYLGIIIHHDTMIISFYDFTNIKDYDTRMIFLEYGEQYWGESHRRIPISIFMRTEMEMFKSCIKHIPAKDAIIVFGPTINLKEIAEKRSKRRTIQLVRSVKKKS